MYTLDLGSNHFDGVGLNPIAARAIPFEMLPQEILQKVITFQSFTPLTWKLCSSLNIAKHPLIF